jgi:hypothetical protein
MMYSRSLRVRVPDAEKLVRSAKECDGCRHLAKTKKKGCRWCNYANRSLVFMGKEKSFMCWNFTPEPEPHGEGPEVVRCGVQRDDSPSAYGSSKARERFQLYKKMISEIQAEKRWPSSRIVK